MLSICEKPKNLFRKSANFCHKQKFQEKDIDSNDQYVHNKNAFQ